MKCSNLLDTPSMHKINLIFTFSMQKLNKKEAIDERYCYSTQNVDPLGRLILHYIDVPGINIVIKNAYSPSLKFKLLFHIAILI